MLVVSISKITMTVNLLTIGVEPIPYAPTRHYTTIEPNPKVNAVCSPVVLLNFGPLLAFPGLVCCF